MDTQEVEWACETVEWACERGTRVTSSAGQHSGWSSRSQSLRLLETSSAEMGSGKVFKMGRGGVPEYTHLPVGETSTNASHLLSDPLTFLHLAGREPISRLSVCYFRHWDRLAGLLLFQ